MKHIIRNIVTTVALAIVAPSIQPVQAGCAKIEFEAVAQLGFIEVAPNVFVLGALPTPTTIAGIPGLLQSVITSLRPSGSKDQGAQHYTLVHTFTSTDPDHPGTFTTEDRAIGSPAGKDPNTGIIDDIMEIVEGTGVFENVSGLMKNHAMVDLTNFTLTVSVHGRICADAL